MTIEEFRKIITREYTEKGALPPAPGSAKEQELFKKWLAGAAKIKSRLDA